MAHRIRTLPWLAALAALLAALAAGAFTAAKAHAIDPVTGERTLLVIGVRWDRQPGFDDSTPDVPPSEIADRVNSAVTPWFQSVSRGMFRGWTAEAAGLYTIDPRDPDSATTPTCDDPNYDPWAWIRRQAKAAAAADGFDVEAYDNVMIWNQSKGNCFFRSRGSVGGRTTWLRSAPTRVMVHELGHNLGLNHSGLLRCRDGGGRQVTLSNDCETTEYGDAYDAMGSGEGSFAASQQWALGWMGQRKLDLTIGAQPAHLYLQPLESAGLTIQALRIEEPDATYWVEYRASLGVDWTPDGRQERTGVVIRRQGLDDPTRSILLDMTIPNPDVVDFDDADLAAGRTWVNPHGDLKYTVNSIGPLGAELTIERKYAPVPDVIGMRRGDAAAALGAAGYVVGRTQFQVDATCNYVDRVKGQTPGAGRRLPAGTAIDLTIGTRPSGGCA